MRAAFRMYIIELTRFENRFSSFNVRLSPSSRLRLITSLMKVFIKQSTSAVADAMGSGRKNGKTVFVVSCLLGLWGSAFASAFRIDPSGMCSQPAQQQHRDANRPIEANREDSDDDGGSAAALLRLNRLRRQRWKLAFNSRRAGPFFGVLRRASNLSSCTERD